MAKRDPHYHLSVLGSARLRIKIHTLLLDKDKTLHGWMKQHGVGCDPRKLVTPSTWRISYGMLHRIARGLETTADRLYRELTA